MPSIKTPQTPAAAENEKWLRVRFLHKFLTPVLVPSKVSDLTPYTHAQSNVIHIKYVKKTDD